MSEPQTEYETEHETDAKPTPGPVAKGVTSSDRRRIAKVLKGTEMVGEHNTHCDIHSKSARIQGQEPVANADLIVAAFNAAQEVREMGYDPVAVQKALPKILEALKDTSEMMDHPHAPGHDARRAKVHDALASAEGSDNE